MHNRLVETILKMKARWLTVFPVSRVYFNASNDVSTLDYRLVVSLRMLFESVALTLAGLAVWNYIYYGVIMIVIALVGVYSVFIIRKFLKTAPFFIRFIAEDRAKVREVFSDTLKYAIYYRVNNKQEIIMDRFILAQNTLQKSSSHLTIHSRRWLGMRLAFAHFFLVLSVYLLPLIQIYFLHSFRLTPFEFGLAISWSLRIMNNFEFLLGSFLDSYLDIPAYGRISYFINHASIETEENKNYIKGN